MIGLVVTGHGNFASGMTSALTLIAGTPDCYRCVDFPQEYSVDDLERDLREAYDALKECEGILVLSDLAGGSPFKSAVICSVEREHINVIAGTNLPMLIEIGMARQFVFDLEDLTNMAIQTGKDQVMVYRKTEAKAQVNDEFEDGI